MQLYAYNALFNSFLAFFLAVLIYFKGRDREISKRFVYLVISYGLWSLGICFHALSNTYSEAHLWDRFLHGVSLWISPFFFHFTLKFLNQKRKALLIYIYAATFFLFIVNLLPLKWLIIGEAARPPFKFFPIYGPLYDFFTLNFTFFMIYPLVLMIRSYKNQNLVKRNQIKFFVVGTVFGLLGGGAAVLFGYTDKFFPYTMFLIPLFFYMYSYAIIKHKMFDLGIALKKGTIYFVAVLFLVLPIYLFAVLINYYLFSDYPIIFYVFLFLAFLFVGYVFPRLKASVERTLEHIFFRGKFDYRTTIESLTNQMASELDLNKLLKNVVTSIVSCTVVKNAIVYLYEDQKLVAHAFAGISKEEMGKMYDIKSSDHIDKRSSISVPIIFKSKNIGILRLGEKEDSTIFTNEETNLLGMLAQQLAVSIENAMSYKVIEDLSKNLEKKVEERTKKLEETQGQLVQAEKMASLGRLASGMAHEIMNPINFIQNSAEPLQENFHKITKNSKLSKKVLKDVWEDSSQLFGIISEGVDRIVKIVRGITTFTRGVTRDFETYDINKAIESALFISENEHKKIGITTDLKAAKEIKCNKGQINQVVLNILMNAFQAVHKSKGKIEIKSWDEEKEIKLSIKDNGPGIKEQDKLKIFDPFYTTKEEAPGQNVGLGLSICYNIIDVHRGRIDVNSKEGEGAEFVVGLPVKN